MAEENFQLAFDLTVGNEGGFQDDPDDRGNWTSGVCGKGELKGTKYGISAMSFPELDIRNLTLEQARDLYFDKYWGPANCDQLPRPVACEVFDAAVNHGVTRAVEFLNEADPHPDGAIWKARLIAVRLRFYTDLKAWNLYGKGWVRRIAKNLENDA